MHLFICFTIWTMVASLMIWRSCQTAKEAVNHLKRLHKIPCAKCLYFTGEYNLKCTVKPSNALSEKAIDCRDFELCSSRQNHIWKKNIQKQYGNWNKLNREI